MKKTLIAAFVGIMMALGLSLSAAPASATTGTFVSLTSLRLHNGEKICNSGASDYSDAVYPNGAGVETGSKLLDPGQCYTLNAGSYSPSNFRIYLEGNAFRVRYNATSGSYQGCQPIAGGSEYIHPADKDRVDLLNYRYSDCSH